MTALKESPIQFSKPRALTNASNPGGRFMSSAMFDAKEAIIPGSVYDRSRIMNGIPSSYRPDYRGLHDPMGYIMSERLHHVTGVNIPVPLNMFAPQTPLLPPYYGQPPPMQNAGQKPRWPPVGMPRKRDRFDYVGDYTNSQASQDIYNSGFSQGPLTQGAFMSGVGQPFRSSQPSMLSGLSQTDFSQDHYAKDPLSSQMERTLLSQDIGYTLGGAPPANGSGHRFPPQYYQPASQQY